MVDMYEMDLRPFKDDQSLTPLLPLLTQERLQRLSRIRKFEERRRSAGAGALLTLVLSRELGMSVEETGLWLNRSIEKGVHGKPSLKGMPHLAFNLSHSGEKVLLALGTHPSGCDIQRMGRSGDSLVQRFYTGEEQELLAHCTDPEERTKLFYALWTMKESYVKETGEGMSRPFDSFQIDLSRIQERKVRRVRDLTGQVRDLYVLTYAGPQGFDGYERCLCLPEPDFPPAILTVEV